MKDQLDSIPRFLNTYKQATKVRIDLQRCMRFHNEDPAGECHDQQTDRQLQDENLTRQVRVSNVRRIRFLDACECV